MSRRLVDSDSDEEVNSSSDEDNGNFKRRRRRYSSNAEEDFVSKTLKTFVTPEPQTVSKPLKPTVAVQKENQLIQKQRVLNEKLSKLPKYDDLFDSATDDCVQTSSVTTYSSRESVSDDTKPKTKTTTIEITTVIQDSEDVAGGDTNDGLNPFSYFSKLF